MTERIAQLEAEIAALKAPPPPEPVVFKPGDLVRLRALNGPVMVVVWVHEEYPAEATKTSDATVTAVRCAWFDKNHVYSSAEMPTAALMAATG
jgi:uncharacterized protein YodC (DUF2158 family)